MMLVSFSALALAYFVSFPDALKVGDAKPLIQEIRDAYKEEEEHYTDAANKRMDLAEGVIAAIATQGASEAAGGGQTAQTAQSIHEDHKEARKARKRAFKYIILVFVILSFGFLGVYYAFGLFEYLDIPIWGILGVCGGGIASLYNLLSGRKENMWFGALVFIGIVFGVASLTGQPFAIFGFVLIILLSCIIVTPEPSVRPIIGVPVLFMALMIATTAYPQVMGEAVFGNWWPAVNQRIEAVQDVVAPATMGFYDVQDTLGTGWTCLISPEECYQMFRPDTEVEKSYVALAITRPEPLGVGTIREPLASGNGAEFEYQFHASNELTYEDVESPPTIEDITFSSLQMYDSSSREFTRKGPVRKDIPSYSRFEAGCPDDKVESGTGERGDVCEGLDLSPGEERTFLVRHYDFAEDVSPGNYLRYGVTAEYTVDTHADLDIEIVSRDSYRDLSRQDFYEPSSRFEWGPVSVGLGVSRQQPIREGDTQPLFFPVTNRGQGYLKGIESLEILLDGEPLGDCSGDIKEFLNDEINRTKDQQQEDIPSGERLGLESGETIDAVCTIDGSKFKIDEGPDREIGLVVDIDYTYEASSVGTVENIYACANDDHCQEDEYCDTSVWECMPE